MRRFLFPLLISLIVIFRLLLILTVSQFGPDEAVFSLRARQILHCLSNPIAPLVHLPSRESVKQDIPPCGQTTLVGLQGRLGIPHGPYPTYWLTFLYWLFHFNLPFIFFLTGLLFLLPPFILAAGVKEIKLRPFVIFLGLTSPLLVSFSLMTLWDTPWLILLAAIIIYLAIHPTQNFLFKNIFLGLLLGISLASHLQSLPFVIGFFPWFVWRQKSCKPTLIMTMTIFLLFCLILLVFLKYATH